jgi:hypothetical protein
MGYLGISLIAIAIILVVVGGMKVVPAYIEYFTLKKAIFKMTESGELRGSNQKQIKDAFNRQAAVDDITAVGAADLDIQINGQDVVLGFAYEKRVHLFSNVSILFEFEASTDPAALSDNTE